MAVFGSELVKQWLVLAASRECFAVAVVVLLHFLCRQLEDLLGLGSAGSRLVGLLSQVLVVKWAWLLGCGNQICLKLRKGASLQAAF